MDDEIRTRWYFDPGENAVTVQRVQDVTDLLEQSKEFAKTPNRRGDVFRPKWSLPNTIVEDLFFKYTEGNPTKAMDDEFWRWVDKRVMSDPDLLHWRTGNKSNPGFIGYHKMITSYDELKLSVARWIARDDLGDKIPDFVTLFESDANRKIRVRQMMVTQSTTPSSGEFPLPNDYLTWVNVRWHGSPIVDLSYTHPTQFANLYWDEPGGVPKIFTVMGTTDNVGVVKFTPSSDNEIEFTFYQKITALSTSNTNWLLVAHPDVYLAGVLVEAYAYTKDYDQAALWKQRRDTMFEEVNTLDQKTRGPSAMKPLGATP